MADKYINATRLIGEINKALNMLEEFDLDIAQRKVDERKLKYTRAVLEGECAAGGEFRRAVHAHWIRQFTDFDHNPHSKCSACNCIFVGEEPFCCRCGAIMDEPSNNKIRE